MKPAGYCNICQKNVFLDNWACTAGHDRSKLSKWYDAETGEPLVPPPAGEGEQPADVAGEMASHIASRLRDVGLSVAQNATMVAVAANDAYEACILVSAKEPTVVLWEHLAHGPDPGVRDFIRKAANSKWKVRVALHPPEPEG
jgi:hypothetical protein